jgi:hypothetical protein
MRIVVKEQRYAACLFPSELSNFDQTTHDGTVILVKDQQFEVVNG